MRVRRFTHNHTFLLKKSSRAFQDKKNALPEMRVRRFTHNHNFLVKKNISCLSRKNIAQAFGKAAEVIVRRATINR